MLCFMWCADSSDDEIADAAVRDADVFSEVSQLAILSLP